MARIITIRQADIVTAFRKTGLPIAKYGGFEDGFKLGAQHQVEAQMEIEARVSHHGTVPSVVQIQIV